MRNKFIKCLSVLVAVIIVFSLFGISVSASSITYYSVPLNQPTVDEYSGYIEYLMYNETEGRYVVNVCFWRVAYSTEDFNNTAFPDENDYDYTTMPAFDINVSSSSVGIQVNFVNSLAVQGVRADYGFVSSIGWATYGSVNNYDNLDNAYLNIKPVVYSGFKVVNFNVYGNCDVLSGKELNSNNRLWGVQYNYTTPIVDAILSLAGSLENGQQGVIDSIEQGTDEIIQKQEENTDKILNGDEDLDSSGETDKVDGALGDVDDSTNNALGGKSEEDIQAEVSGAIDSEKLNSIDLTKANRMSSFYDRCLKVFGKDYNSLLFLSLILGLSAFLIGRRYG